MRTYLIKIIVVLLPMIFYFDRSIGADLTTVYFVPFQVETYVPITQATIVSMAWEKWNLKSNEQKINLNAILNSGNPSEFESKRIRVLIMSADGTIYIDANGVASTGGSSGVLIDKKEFLKFRESLNAVERQTFR